MRLGTERQVFVVVDPSGRKPYAACDDIEGAECYSRETGFPIEVWTKRLEQWPNGSLEFWNLIDPQTEPATATP